MKGVVVWWCEERDWLVQSGMMHIINRSIPFCLLKYLFVLSWWWQGRMHMLTFFISKLRMPPRPATDPTNPRQTLCRSSVGIITVNLLGSESTLLLQLLLFFLLELLVDLGAFRGLVAVVSGLQIYVNQPYSLSTASDRNYSPATSSQSSTPSPLGSFRPRPRSPASIPARACSQSSARPWSRGPGGSWAGPP